MTNDSPKSGPIAQFTQDFGFYTLTRFIPALLGLVAVIIFTRVFDPAAYGRYSIVIVCVTILSTAIFGWLEQAVLRFESDKTEIGPTVFAISILLGICGIALGILGFVFVTPTHNTYRPFIIPATITIVCLGLFNVFRAIFQARLDASQVTIYTALQSFLKVSVGIVISFFILHSIVGWVWGTAIGSLTTVVAMSWQLSLPRPRIEKKVAKRLLQYGVPMIGWLFGMTLLTFVDRLLIELLATTSAVGIYSSNYSLVQTGLPLVLAPIIQTAHPIIMNEWNGTNHTHISSLIRKYSRYYLIFGVGATIFAGIISRPLSMLILGDSYHSGYTVIPIIGVALLLWNFGMLGHKGLELKNLTALMTGGILLAVVSNIIFNYLFIPTYGYTGAAVATLGSSAVYVGFVYLFSFRTVRWRIPAPSLVKVGTAGTIMIGIGGMGYVVNIHIVITPLVTAILGGLVYLLVLYELGEFRNTELTVVETAVRKYTPWLKY